ncbi:MAG: hypothetical protein ACLFU4_04625 [Opitutales bacterium]
MRKRVYVDMDGVMCDFISAFNRARETHPEVEFPLNRALGYHVTLFRQKIGYLPCGESRKTGLLISLKHFLTCLLVSKAWQYSPLPQDNFLAILVLGSRVRQN